MPGPPLGPDEPQDTPTGSDILSGILSADAAAALAAGKTLTVNWASRPAASAYPNGRIFVPDIGVGGSLWSSNGILWQPIAPITLVRSGVKVSIPNNTLTTEQQYVSVPVPAGVLGLSGALQIDTLWSYTGSTNTKTMRGRFSGSGGSAIISVAQSTAANITSRATAVIRNSDATHQVSAPTILIGGTSTGTTGAVVRPNVDTTVATTVYISGQTALAGEVLDLEWHEVRLLP